MYIIHGIHSFINMTELSDTCRTVLDYSNSVLVVQSFEEENKQIQCRRPAHLNDSLSLSPSLSVCSGSSSHRTLSRTFFSSKFSSLKYRCGYRCNEFASHTSCLRFLVMIYRKQTSD